MFIKKKAEGESDDYRFILHSNRPYWSFWKWLHYRRKHIVSA